MKKIYKYTSSWGSLRMSDLYDFLHCISRCSFDRRHCKPVWDVNDHKWHLTLVRQIDHNIEYQSIYDEYWGLFLSQGDNMGSSWPISWWYRDWNILCYSHILWYCVAQMGKYKWECLDLSVLPLVVTTWCPQTGDLPQNKSLVDIYLQLKLLSILSNGDVQKKTLSSDTNILDVSTKTKLLHSCFPKLNEPSWISSTIIERIILHVD